MFETLMANIFSKRRAGLDEQLLFVPPPGVAMTAVKPRGEEIVSARLAKSDGAIESERGRLSFEAGKHYLVRYSNGDEAPVLKAIFERLYRRRIDGKYEKRRDVRLRYFTLPYAVRVMTMEGPRTAAPGDWIIEGVIGELYPAPAAVAESKYERI
jgi:hypothetical protein